MKLQDRQSDAIYIYMNIKAHTFAEWCNERGCIHLEEVLKQTGNIEDQYCMEEDRGAKIDEENHWEELLGPSITYCDFHFEIQVKRNKEVYKNE